MSREKQTRIITLVIMDQSALTVAVAIAKMRIVELMEIIQFAKGELKNLTDFYNSNKKLQEKLF